MEIDVSRDDRTILRDLAKRVVEIAALPVMAERKELWRQHNGLHRVRPMILVFPEGSWRELLPPSALRCEGKAARAMEAALRRRIYTHEHFRDDTVIEDDWTVHRVVRSTGWGLEPRWHYSDDPTGARAFDPVIQGPADLQKLRFPDIWVDEEATQRQLALGQELFGDILRVQEKGVPRLSYHLMSQYTALRGLEQVMVDMLEHPQMLQDAMAFLEEGHHRLRQQYVDLNLLSPNNDNTYSGSGGVGWTDELPQPGSDPNCVRPCDVWSFAEAQELAQVSPEMHAEFVLQYEQRLLAPFGLNAYGCCDDLTRKLDDVLAIPHLRRVSISPWADVERCAEKLQSKCVFSWKPHPAYLAGDFSPEAIRQYLKQALDVTRDCVIELVLKDTHTCEHHPERFAVWTEIARDLVEQY